MKKNNSLIFFSIALIISAIIIGGSIVYFTQSESATASILSADKTIKDKNNNIYVVGKEDPVKMTVISDANCVACDTGKLETWLKGQISVPIAIRKLDYSTKEAKQIISNDKATFLPYLIIDKEIEKHPDFTHLTHHTITKSNSGYFLDLTKMGSPIGRYLNATYYTKDDIKAPKITATVKTYDFGDVYLSKGKVSKEFIIKNEGKSPLEFLNANTSCGCTSATIVLPDKTSPLYMMAGHGASVKWSGSLAPGKEGKIVVYYDPSVHPDLTGAVTREVTVDTNDPNTPQLKLTINANQIAK